jgi:flagellar biosynthesis/type III secretory pathway chaperone
MINTDAMKNLQHISRERAPFYKKANVTLDTSNKTVEESFDELLLLIKKYNQ